MARTKQEISTADIGKLADDLAKIASELKEVHAEMEQAGVQSTTVFVGSLPWAFNFLLKFTGNLKIEIRRQDMQSSFGKQLPSWKPADSAAKLSKETSKAASEIAKQTSLKADAEAKKIAEEVIEEFNSRSRKTKKSGKKPSS